MTKTKYRFVRGPFNQDMSVSLRKEIEARKEIEVNTNPTFRLERCKLPKCNETVVVEIGDVIGCPSCGWYELIPNNLIDCPEPYSGCFDRGTIATIRWEKGHGHATGTRWIRFGALELMWDPRHHWRLWGPRIYRVMKKFVLYFGNLDIGIHYWCVGCCKTCWSKTCWTKRISKHHFRHRNCKETTT